MNTSRFPKIQALVEAAFSDRTLLSNPETQDAIREVIDSLDTGELRVATKEGNDWQVHQWIKKAVLLYFAKDSQTIMALLPMMAIKF
jgi:2,3,4,5-tetrahydropyridine-2-carboxylate N-succinyltransferase